MNFHRTLGTILTRRLARIDMIIMKYHQTDMNLSGPKVGCEERDYDAGDQKVDFTNVY